MALSFGLFISFWFALVSWTCVQPGLTGSVTARPHWHVLIAKLKFSLLFEFPPRPAIVNVVDGDVLFDDEDELDKRFKPLLLLILTCSDPISLCKHHFF